MPQPGGTIRGQAGRMLTYGPYSPVNLAARWREHP
jgi:hypothetical protein